MRFKIEALELSKDSNLDAFLKANPSELLEDFDGKLALITKDKDLPLYPYPLLRYVNR